MADLNKVILMGRMTADPELKQTPSGVSVCSFNIAVNRRFKAEGQQDVDFISIVAWRQQAEFICKYCKKGQAIVVCGQIQTRNFTDNQGNKRYATEVVADEVSFAGNAPANKEGGASPSPTEPYVPTPYANGNSQNFEEIPGDESLPF